MKENLNPQLLHDLVERVDSLNSQVDLNPKTTALIIVDMQQDYVSSDGGFASKVGGDLSVSQCIISPLINFAQKFRDKGSPVIFTRMVEVPKYMPNNLGEQIDSFPEPVHRCDPETSGFDYYGIKPQAGDLEVIKNTYNVFLTDHNHSILKNANIHTALLDTLLKERNIDTLVFTGVLTGRCVLTSLLGAIDHGYKCVVPSDLVAMPHGPWRLTHYVTLSEMSIMYAKVTKSDKINLAES